MAKFKILRSRRASDPKLTDFVLQMQSGSLAPGDIFYCYETHHPVKVKVISSQTTGESLTITADTNGWFGYEDQWVGAFVDTDGKTKYEAYRFPIQDI
jgi:hypothetical protein